MRALLLVLLTVLGMTPALAAGDNYLNSSLLRVKALDVLFARVGETRPLARLSFSPDQIMVAAQADSREAFAEWTVHRVDLLLLNVNSVTGPVNAPAFSVVDDIKGAFFRRDEIDLRAFDAVTAAAIAYAKLEDVPMVVSAEIARHVSILPEPRYSDVRWTIELRTAREKAIVYLDADGTVRGGDLSDTIRAKTLDMLANDEWPMADAQELLAQVIGAARVHEVRINESYISITADHPTDSALERDYTWTLEGVTQGLVDTPNRIELGMGDIASFALNEVDFTKLPVVKAAAMAAFDSPDAVIVGLEASQPTDRAAGALQVLWKVELRQTNGETGSVLTDADGQVVAVNVPDSRLPAVGPWLAPATVINTLKRIAEAFGPDAKLSEISINDTQASIDIEDPQAPGEVAHFLMGERDAERFGTGSFFASLEPGNVFTPADLAGLTTEQLTDMVRRTEERLKMKDGAVFRFTFSRHALIMDPSDNRLMVEIRYGEEQIGGDAGWMTFLLDGTQTDELVP